eukprot:s45_g26.t2
MSILGGFLGHGGAQMALSRYGPACACNIRNHEEKPIADLCATGNARYTEFRVVEFRSKKVFIRRDLDLTSSRGFNDGGTIADFGFVEGKIHHVFFLAFLQTFPSYNS